MHQNKGEIPKMKSKLRSKQSGFTIVEVMIVIAIAGLIMLIVFLAVPALQRNSRNTQRKNDVSALLGAINEYTSNHNGSLPPAVGDVTGNAQLGFYADTAVSFGTEWPSDADTVVIAKNEKCTSESATDTQARAVAVLYNVETSSDTEPQCDGS
jgi:prepilin-type N-terminal cleavage/methylation domain-containing protein